jgi:AcrR family transcriptional regulator
MYVSQAAPRPSLDPMRKTRKTNAEYSAQMQRKLTQIARSEFAKHGYADTGTERIVMLAKVTRGALYHHYKDKRALFEAVFAELAADVAERIERDAVRAKDPMAALIAGCEAWLSACMDPIVRQILLIDGPSVLGWRRWSEIDAQHGTRSLRLGIEACQRAGVLVDVDAALLTRLLAGAVNDVALVLADAGDARALRPKLSKTLRALIEGLRKR